jgi:hypothetical protein
VPGGLDGVAWAKDCWARIAALCGSDDGPVPGGCWNQPGSGQVQNSIVNALYLTLSVRLYRETSDARTYLPAIGRSVGWFLGWIDPPSSAPAVCPATVNRQGDPTGLLRNGVYRFDPVQDYTFSIQLPEQAILFAGLAELAALDPSAMEDRGDLDAVRSLRESQEGARNLLGRLSAHWTRFFTPKGVLQVPPFSFNAALPDAMVVGKGPFLRYALEAEAALLAHGSDLTEYYQPTADAAWATRRDGSLGPDWVPAGPGRKAFAESFHDFYTSGLGPRPAACPALDDPDYPFLPESEWCSYGFSSEVTQSPHVAITVQTLGLDAMTAAMAHWPKGQ